MKSFTFNKVDENKPAIIKNGDLAVSAINFWSKVGNAISNLLFIEHCRICGEHCAWVNEKYKAVSESKQIVCINTKSPKTICIVCWQELVRQKPVIDCCVANGKTFKVVSATLYGGTMKKLIYHLKYDGDRLIAYDLAQLLLDVWKYVVCDLKDLPILFVPIPLHKQRLLNRGYNQAEILARSAAKHLALDVDAVALKRIKSTVAQHGLGRSQRLVNLQGAFASDVKRVLGKAIVLIDDVCTSGTTLSEAARTLLEHGAAKVIGLTVARAMLGPKTDDLII